MARLQYSGSSIREKLITDDRDTIAVLIDSDSGPSHNLFINSIQDFYKYYNNYTQSESWRCVNLLAKNNYKFLVRRHSSWNDEILSAESSVIQTNNSNSNDLNTFLTENSGLHYIELHISETFKLGEYISVKRDNSPNFKLLFYIDIDNKYNDLPINDGYNKTVKITGTDPELNLEIDTNLETQVDKIIYELENFGYKVFKVVSNSNRTSFSLHIVSKFSFSVVRGINNTIDNHTSIRFFNVTEYSPGIGTVSNIRSGQISITADDSSVDNGMYVESFPEYSPYVVRCKRGDKVTLSSPLYTTIGYSHPDYTKSYNTIKVSDSGFSIDKINASTYTYAIKLNIPNSYITPDCIEYVCLLSATASRLVVFSNKDTAGSICLHNDGEDIGLTSYTALVTYSDRFITKLQLSTSSGIVYKTIVNNYIEFNTKVSAGDILSYSSTGINAIIYGLNYPVPASGYQQIFVVKGYSTSDPIKSDFSGKLVSLKASRVQIRSDDGSITKIDNTSSDFYCMKNIGDEVKLNDILFNGDEELIKSKYLGTVYSSSDTEVVITIENIDNLSINCPSDAYTTNLHINDTIYAYHPENTYESPTDPHLSRTVVYTDGVNNIYYEGEYDGTIIAANSSMVIIRVTEIVRKTQVNYKPDKYKCFVADGNKVIVGSVLFGYKLDPVLSRVSGTLVDMDNIGARIKVSNDSTEYSDSIDYVGIISDDSESYQIDRTQYDLAINPSTEVIWAVGDLVEVGDKILDTSNSEFVSKVDGRIDSITNDVVNIKVFVKKIQSVDHNYVLGTGLSNGSSVNLGSEILRYNETPEVSTIAGRVVNIDATNKLITIEDTSTSNRTIIKCSNKKLVPAVILQQYVCIGDPLFKSQYESRFSTIDNSRNPLVYTKLGWKNIKVVANSTEYNYCCVLNIGDAVSVGTTIYFIDKDTLKSLQVNELINKLKESNYNVSYDRYRNCIYLSQNAAFKLVQISESFTFEEWKNGNYDIICQNYNDEKVIDFYSKYPSDLMDIKLVISRNTRKFKSSEFGYDLSVLKLNIDGTILFREDYVVSLNPNSPYYIEPKLLNSDLVVIKYYSDGIMPEGEFYLNRTNRSVLSNRELIANIHNSSFNNTNYELMIDAGFTDETYQYELYKKYCDDKELLCFTVDYSTVDETLLNTLYEDHKDDASIIASDRTSDEILKIINSEDGTIDTNLLEEFIDITADERFDQLNKITYNNFNISQYYEWKNSVFSFPYIYIGNFKYPAYVALLLKLSVENAFAGELSFIDKLDTEIKSEFSEYLLNIDYDRYRYVLSHNYIYDDNKNVYTGVVNNISLPDIVLLLSRIRNKIYYGIEYNTNRDSIIEQFNTLKTNIIKRSDGVLSDIYLENLELSSENRTCKLVTQVYFELFKVDPIQLEVILNNNN